MVKWKLPRNTKRLKSQGDGWQPPSVGPFLLDCQVNLRASEATASGERDRSASKGSLRPATEQSPAGSWCLEAEASDVRGSQVGQKLRALAEKHAALGQNPRKPLVNVKIGGK